MRDDSVDGATIRDVVRKRSTVLNCLLDDPVTKPELLDRLPVSRSTVDRALDSLVDAGLVRRVDGQFHVTPSGRLAVTAYEEYVDTTATLAEAGPLLDGIPTDVTVPRSLLTTGVIEIAEPHAPESAITEAVSRLQSTERLFVLSPVVKSSYISRVYEQVAQRNIEVTLILGRDATDSLAALASMTDTVGELVSSGTFSLLTTDREPPFLLYVMCGPEGDSVGVTVHEEGGIVGSVVTKDPAAVSWGRDWFNDVRTDAEPVDPSELF